MKRVPTRMFNGYADDVSDLYSGMDLKRFLTIMINALNSALRRRLLGRSIFSRSCQLFAFLSAVLVPWGWIPSKRLSINGTLGSSAFDCWAFDLAFAQYAGLNLLKFRRAIGVITSFISRCICWSGWF